jgi:L-arabinose transport system substrate-binding protein
MVGKIRQGRRSLLISLFFAGLAFMVGVTPAEAQRIKIGFVVKQPEEPWFQLEWKFAQQAADKDGFDLIKLGAPDEEKTMSAIDNLNAQGAQGLVICTPDVKLGRAILAKVNEDGMKLLTVDDQFVKPDGQFMTDVHHLGISATSIGRKVGKALWDQMQARGWKIEDTAVCAVTHDEVETHAQRTDGAIAALTEAGFPAGRIYKAAEKNTVIEGAFDATNALLIQHPEVKHWLICSINDTGVLGAVRATEGQKLGASDVCGIGINGSDCINEFKKDKPTGFYASILLSPRRHGFETADMMYHWIKDGTEPPKITYTEGRLITRDNFQQALVEEGMN